MLPQDALLFNNPHPLSTTSPIPLHSHNCSSLTLPPPPRQPGKAGAHQQRGGQPAGFVTMGTLFAFPSAARLLLFSWTSDIESGSQDSSRITIICLRWLIEGALGTFPPQRKGKSPAWRRRTAGSSIPRLAACYRTDLSLGLLTPSPYKNIYNTAH